MSKGFLSFALRLASVAVQFIPGIGQLAAAAITIGLNVGAQLLAPKVKQQPRQASATSLQLGEVPRQAIFGRAAVAGSLTYAFNYGGENGTDWEVLVLALADHECEALEGFYVNDTYVEFVSDGLVAGYNNQLMVFWRTGTEDQLVPDVLINHGGYAASDNGAGVSYVVVCYKADDTKTKTPIWPGGRPRFLWVMRGVKCYSARDDSTVEGGAGAHRWDNPATREWSENAIDCRYTWVRGLYACNRVNDPDMLLIGRGLSEVEAPPANVAARANLCDEPVLLTSGGTEARYRCGGLIKADDEFLTVEEFFASACGGVITQPEGCVEIEPGQAKAPSFVITDADLIVGSEVRWNDFLGEANDEWVNTVVPRYVEPSQRWADHAAPIRRVIADVIEDGRPREETLSLPMVNSATQAGRCGEIRRRLGRLQGRGSLTVGPRFSEIEEGDWGIWYSDRRFDGAGRTVRVESWAQPENGQMTLQLRQISATCFSDGDFFEDGSVAEPQDPPSGIGAPAPGSWTLTAEQIDPEVGIVPALVFTGTVEDPFARFVRIEYWQNDGATAPEDVETWNSVGVFGPDVTRREVTGVAGGTSYYGAVSYMVGDIQGERLILGPVTTPGVTLGGVDIDLVIQQYMDYSEENDNNALPPPAATSVTVTGIKFNDASGAAIVSWAFTRSTDPAAANNIDGYRVGLMARTSPLGYPYNPADDNNIRWTNVTPDITSVAFPSVAVDLNCTAIVIPYRNVRTAVNAETIIYGPPAQSSSTTPYKQADAANFKGEIDGASAVSVRVGSGKANVAIDDDNNISSGRVLTGSILEGAINEADWVVDPAGIGLGLNDIYGYNVCPVESTGNRMVIKFILPYRIEVLDPDPGDECYFTINLWAERQSNGADYYSDTFTVSDVWTASAATGLKYFGTRAVMIEATFDGLPAGPYKVGWVGETNSTCGVFIASPRYVNGDDKRAAS